MSMRLIITYENYDYKKEKKYLLFANLIIDEIQE